MHIYLPIAEMPVNILLLLSLGGVTGILSGMFGIGGGFLTTPFLIFIGLPPAVAVSSSANQIIAASVSGFIAHWQRGNVDFKIGFVIMAGGIIGSSIGVLLFRWLQELGQIDLVISLSYVIFLGFVGLMMAWESWSKIWRSRFSASSKNKKTEEKSKNINWFKKLPFKMRFPHSKIYISVLVPIMIGVFTGVLVSLMGIGGGFVMIPAMIYLLGMPTSVVIGTSLFQIIFITANVTFLQSVSTQTVDIVLALILLTGSVLGAQIGTRIGAKIAAEQLRGLLALLVLAVVAKLAFGLFVEPSNPYTISKIV